MIQRIQSLFLLAATLLSGSMLFYPFAHYHLKNGDLIKIYSKGLFNITQNIELPLSYIFLLILFALVAIISLVIIFIYTKRNLQMKLCVYNILLTIIQAIVVFYYYFRIKNSLPVQTSSITIIGIFPIINIILIFQAFRAIRRDDLLIKSYDRLR